MCIYCTEAAILNVPIAFLISTDDEDKDTKEDPGSEIRRLLIDCNHIEKKILVETIRSLKRILLSEGIRYNHRKTSYRLLQVFYYHLGDDSFGFFFSSS